MRQFFILKILLILRYFNFEPSFKLRWCRARDLLGSQIPVATLSLLDNLPLFTKLLYFLKKKSNLASLIFSKIVKSNLGSPLPASVSLYLACSFLIVHQIIFLVLLSEQHLILYVYLNQLILIYNDV